MMALRRSLNEGFTATIMTEQDELNFRRSNLRGRFLQTPGP